MQRSQHICKKTYFDYLIVVRQGDDAEEATQVIDEEDSRQMVGESIVSGCVTGGDANFAVNRGQVSVNGARADDQFLGYLGIGESLGNQA